MNTRTVKQGISAMLAQYVMLGQQVKQVNTRRGDLKKDLLAVVDDDHEVDEEKGHLTHLLDEPVETPVGRFRGFMKQRRVSQKFLEDKAETLCKRLEIDPDEYTSRYVDQDKIVRLYAEDRITDAQFAKLWENNVTFAFVPVEDV